MVPFTHGAFFVANLLRVFYSAIFFVLDAFLLHDFFSVEQFFMLKLVALLFVFTIDKLVVALPFVFPKDNRYAYILMHFKGSTDLVNSAKL